jgi:adenine deaminase
LRFENQINSERGFPDYAKRREYNIQWSHSQDGKANPNSRFSASVNLGSSTYFQNSLNQVNVGSRLNNVLTSSISYSKTFNTVPSVNLALTANHSQNTQAKTINMTLPTFTANVDRIFLFGKKDEPKKGFIKNIGLTKGALASSVAHDSHNIVAVGVDDQSICEAVNLIIKSGGGVSAVSENDKIVLSLPVAGLMSNLNGYDVAKAYTEIDLFSKNVLGSRLSAPFMTLSFMALLVIPHLKLSDKGLFDGNQFKFI